MLVPCFVCGGIRWFGFYSRFVDLVKKDRLIARLAKIHNNMYDYSLLPDDINLADKILVRCKTHGVFAPTCHDHLYHKTGCPICSVLSKTKEHNTFVDQAISVHGDKYDYSRVNYVNSYTKVMIVCKRHGAFTQVPYSHVNYATGCPKCSSSTKSLGWASFVEKSKKVHGDKYDYADVKYTNVRTPVDIKCKTHGRFVQTPSNHIYRKAGCPLCAQHTKYNSTFFNNEHTDRLDGVLYLVKGWDNNETFVKIGITKHKDVSLRYIQPGDFPYNMECLFVKEMKLKEAYVLEQHILKMLQEYRITPKVSFSGKTECLKYCPTVLNTIQEVMEEECLNHGNNRR